MAKNEGVLDAGPLIHLSELNALDALQGLGALYISPAVAEEVKRHQPDALLISGLTFVDESSLVLTPELISIGQVFLLDRGELEALVLMQLFPGAIFFTDDSAARLVAEQMDTPTHGTIGLLVRMVRQGYRKPGEVIALLETIPLKSTLHVRKSLLDEVIRELKIEWGIP